MEQLKLDVGLMVEKMTQITIMFRRIKLRMEEYVCLKVYILLNKGELGSWLAGEIKGIKTVTDNPTILQQKSNLRTFRNDTYKC